MAGWGSKRGQARRAARAAAAGAEHQRRRLVNAADWAITMASRRLRDGEPEPVAVTVADVVERAAYDGLAVTHAAAAAVLRERIELRGGLGLATDAYKAGLSDAG